MPLNIDLYKNNLSVKSNDNNIIKRDGSGNLIKNDQTTLFIEPITWKYTTDSINKVIDTTFKYFKFPAVTATIPDPEIPVITLDSDITSSIESVGSGIISPLVIRIKPSALIQEALIYSSKYTQFNLDEVVDGMPQLEPNRFIITQDILDRKKDLKFHAKIAILFTDNHDKNTFITRLINRNPNVINPRILDKKTNLEYGGYVGTTPLTSLNQEQLLTSTTLSKLKTELSYDFTYYVKLKDTIALQLDTFISGLDKKTYKAELIQLNKYNNYQERFDYLYSLTKPSSYKNQQFSPAMLQFDINKFIPIYNDWTSVYKFLTDFKGQQAIIQKSIDEFEQKQLSLEVDEFTINGTATAGYLWPSSTPYIIEINQIVPYEDLKLYDYYAIDYRVGQWLDYAPLLIEDLTYLEVTAVK